jgi:hypothetical protein
MAAGRKQTMDADAYDALMLRMAAVLDKISESYDKLVEFNARQTVINDEQRQINGRLEVLIRAVLRQRRNGGDNGGRHA